MTHSLIDFKSALRGGGARPNLFEVEITGFPGDGPFEAENFSMLCKASSLPASNIPQIDVPFRGRTFKVSGDRTYDPWSITVINDENFRIRTAMEQWMQSIGQYADGSGFTDPFDYMVDAEVRHLGRLASDVGPNIPTGTGLDTIATYKFYDIFPTSISAIDLSYDSSDTIEEFTVEFAVQYWTPMGTRDVPANP